MNRREKFEAYWAEQNDVPVETMAQYRCDDERKYRLPKMASRYRVWCAALDSVVVDLPDSDTNIDYSGYISRNEAIEAIEAAGLKVSN